MDLSYPPDERLVYPEETTCTRVALPLNVLGISNIAPAIMQYGTESQKTTLLPTRGGDSVCILYTLNYDSLREANPSGFVT